MCKKQVGRKGERRTAGFGCFFYDGLVVETAGSAEDIQGTVRVGLPLTEDHVDADACRIKVLRTARTAKIWLWRIASGERTDWPIFALPIQSPVNCSRFGSGMGKAGNKWPSGISSSISI